MSAAPAKPKLQNLCPKNLNLNLWEYWRNIFEKGFVKLSGKVLTKMSAAPAKPKLRNPNSKNARQQTQEPKDKHLRRLVKYFLKGFIKLFGKVLTKIFFEKMSEWKIFWDDWQNFLTKIFFGRLVKLEIIFEKIGEAFWKGADVIFFGRFKNFLDLFLRRLVKLSHKDIFRKICKTRNYFWEDWWNFLDEVWDWRSRRGQAAHCIKAKVVNLENRETVIPSAAQPENATWNIVWPENQWELVLSYWISPLGTLSIWASVLNDSCWMQL